MQEHQISSNKIYKLNYNCDLRVKISAQLIDSHTQKTLETENFEAHNHDNVENAFLLENKKKGAYLNSLLVLKIVSWVGT